MTISSPFATIFTNADEPIRSELFSIERLEQHAETLAAAQTVNTELTAGRPLTPRVFENGRALFETYRALADAIQQDLTITPAAEWLVDNFHIVDEQLREIREDLPPGFYRKLPKLSSGILEGYPRVFGVAWAFVAHTDSRFDPEVLRRFVKAYQRVQPLTIGELWAVAITLRVVLIENLRRLSGKIVQSRAARQEADALADSLLGTNGPGDIRPEAELKRLEGKPLATAFAVELLQRLRDLNPNVRPVLLWLDDRLAEQKTTAEEIVRAEHQQQAGMNVTVRNIITSMRLMSAFEWRDFFESVSLVDEVLADDTNFAELDFSTRDAYRHAIESLSRGSRHSEVEIAQRVVQHVKRARIEARNNLEKRRHQQTDPGHYLISHGRPEFERELGFRLSWKRRILRSYMHTALPGYLGTIAVVTAAILALPLIHDSEAGVGLKGLLLLGILGAFPASDLAIALINRAVTDWLGPRTLPRLALRSGVPESLRTIVVVPTLLTSLHEVEELLGRLEAHYLANPDASLHFALLTDWADAATEHLSTDDELLKAAIDGIARLNDQHGPAPGEKARFLLFHRRRLWNEEEGRWIGWERKRGKLHELNRLLRGATNTTFVRGDGYGPQWLHTAQYVITLDTDTRLPPGAARRLVGTMAHPLNRPEFSARGDRVVEGYAVMQPRIMPTLPTDHEASLFQKIYSGPSGIDAYASAVSDVYQDLFREGSYTGKGIYDIDAFEAALEGKVPDNTLLSHDLFEGVFARTALVTDIELFEEFPVHYETSAARQHRWARGDWQLLPWILGWRMNSLSDRPPSPVPAVGRWKMIDNLRRTLSPPAALLTLVAGWLLPPASPWVWTRFILATVAIPALLPVLIGLDPRLGGVSKRSHLRALLSDLSVGLSQIGLALAFLAYQAWLMSDAIVRTLVRLFITHKNMLEWMTAAQAKYAVDFKLSNMYKRMVGGIALAGAVALGLAVGRPQALMAGVPFLLLWAVAPAVARWISTPPPPESADTLSVSETQMLRHTARRTWRFFETFVSAEDHWLPPDNFQEDPKPVVAHRTSPTNIGLYLLATLSAHDLGWIGTIDTVERLEATLETMSRMELFRGHFYNWYDSSDLRPLEPKYISSVDSGNLAGHLLALCSGCRELLNRTFNEGSMLTGVRDCLLILRKPLADIGDARRTSVVTKKQLSNAIEELGVSLEPIPASAIALAARMTELRARSHTLADIARTFAQGRADDADAELRVWADAAQASVNSHFRDARIFDPWCRLEPKEIAELSKNPLHATDWLGADSLAKRLPKLAEAPRQFERILEELASVRERLLQESPTNLPAINRVDALMGAFRQSATDAADLICRIEQITETAENMFHGMDFSFLFDDTRKLFSIGYRVADGTLDAACYDLLASEARLTSFVAISKGDAPLLHWFRLGRALTPVGRGSALVSWSGSMFEYLMPELVMRAPTGSLLNETARLVVERQIEYGRDRGVPWGVSESAFNARDIDLRYQYSGFGVPGLGLKRGLSQDVVVAPYATALAAIIEPSAAVAGLDQIAKAGGSGSYGFYEALDYTSTRVPEGKTNAVVRAYFAHHQGMTLVALSNVLTDGTMRARFHAEPTVKAFELLLQERTPRDVLVTRPRAEEVSAGRVRELLPPVVRRFTTPHDLTPRTHLISNGRYAVMLTAAGSGYSRWRDIAITRWREDATLDNWGSYIYLRDINTQQVWSAGYQPCGSEPDSYEASFFEDRAEIVRRDRSLTTMLEVIVSSDDDAEMRRVSITNQGARPREIQVTSYSEVCLTPQATDAAHPAFSNLFVETEFAADPGALLATRRRRSPKESPLWLAHVTAVDGETIGELEYETDRAQFIGRGRHLRNAVSIFDAPHLYKTVGSVLDPVMSLRQTLRIPPGTTARVIFSTMVAPTREDALNMADKHRDASIFERTLTLAWTQSQVQLRHLEIESDEANLFQKLANHILFSDSSLRPSSDVLGRSTLDLAQLWAQGISGDKPILLAFIDDTDDIELVRQLLRAHEYFRMKQLPADLVIINEKLHSYAQDLQNALEALVRGSQLRLSPETGDAVGNIFLLRAELIPSQLRTILQTMARAVLFSRRGTLAEQINRSQRPGSLTFPAPRVQIRDGSPEQIPVPQDLAFWNGLGGFDENGTEYVTVLGEGIRTPQPWINVIANPGFGFLVSESGSGYTWAVNSHENQLTPWSNDSVIDPPGEAIYISDSITGEFWSPTASPVREEAAVYVCRHGQGYTRFQHSSHGILHDLVQFVPPKDPIKISKLVLENKSGRPRRLSVTAYAEWVLGSSRTAAAPYIVTELDPKTGALFARSLWETEFGGRVAFADLAGRQTSWTGDRKEFLGRNGGVESPAALERASPLSGNTGAGLDPCAALQTSIELRPGGRAEVVFFLGQAENREEAGEILKRYRSAKIDALFREVTRVWDAMLCTVQVTTPEPAMDLLLNRWLLYQTLSCRIWARAAFYQVSGAYGFRDQLQDITALCVANRDVAREQLLRAASRQFTEGDVQHWWHPPSGRGVRTRISDDLLWLPYAVNQFIEATSDASILDEVVAFLDGETLAEGQESSYFEPRVSDEKATLYEHCARALDRSLAVGSHGLPLIGSGDWNDGMNLVGVQGKGESIWLGWFLHAVLSDFARLADTRGEHQRAQIWRLQVTALKAALEKEGWDGEWYRRAYFDDGTPLGSAQNDECRIDSIAQSWGVISGAAEPGRAARAMEALERQLVRRADRLVLLLTPPFDHTPLEPGYIKGYVPGIRENGGQYTHAATWSVIAFAALGDGDRACDLFRILNPINHALSRVDVQRYKVEPYVLAGDVYSEPPHVGRGGWTWYTGSSGWLYRAGVEWILGFRLHGMIFSLNPCIPRNWSNFSLLFRYHSAVYRIRVENPSGVTRGVALTRVDGKIFAGSIDIGLADDGAEHEVLVVMG